MRRGRGLAALLGAGFARHALVVVQRDLLAWGRPLAEPKWANSGGVTIRVTGCGPTWGDLVGARGDGDGAKRTPA